MEEERSKLLKVLDWIEGKDDGVIKHWGHPAKGTKWYIVSCKWLNKWKRINKLTNDVTDEDMDEDLGEIDSEDIIDNNPKFKTKKNNHILKPDLKVGHDFEILPAKAWDFLSGKHGFIHEITRKSIEVNNDRTIIEITLFPVNIIFVEYKILKSEEPLTYFFSRKKTASGITRTLEKEISTKSAYPNTKLWKLDDDTSISELADMIKSHVNGQIIFPGALLDSRYEPLEKLELKFDDTLVFEVAKEYSTHLFKEKDKIACEFCRKYNYNARKCFCGKYYYCSDMCEERDKNYHFCRKLFKIYKQTDQSCMGRAGLQNLGNTCYMNSGLQCLSNTYELTRYILEDLYQNDVNKENLLGSKGELIEEYAILIKEMWYGSSHNISPWGVKRAFSDFAKQFIGFHQQDSQEMLGFLIDGIHEDLNRVKTKPYVEDPDTKTLSEQEVAEKFWENHKLRNDSIIVDLMHGQYRSEVECPECNKVSVTFDPFLMLTLPISENQVKNYEVTVVDFNKALRCKVTANKGSSVRVIRAKVCDLLKMPDEGIIVAEINMGTLKGIFKDDSKVSKKNSIFMYKNFEPVENEDDYYTFFCDYRKKSYGYGSHTFGQPHLLRVRKDFTVKDLYMHVFQFVQKLKSQEINDLEEEFRKKFLTFFERSYGENYFQLKIHNPYQYPCALCERISCPGCVIDFSEKRIEKFVSRCKESNLRISVNFSESGIESSFFSAIESHESCYSNNYNNKNSDSATIDECFSLFLKKEQLDEQNTIYCSNCKDHVRGFKKMDVYRLPEILIIHLKRFKQKEHFSSKNNKLVEFPLEGLDMSKYTMGAQGVYDLYAVSNHYGSLEGGHYTAYAKSQDGLWRDFDDSSVSIIHNVNDTVVATSAYVLFYQKRKVIS